MSKAENRRKMRERLERIGLDTQERSIVWAMCKHDLKLSPAARELYYASNTSLVYQLDKIQNKTGFDPRNFYDMVELLKMAGRDPLREYDLYDL